MMSLQLLEDKRVGELNDEQEQLSKSIKENSERLLSITGELLNMTQVEAGKLQLMPKITKPIELIEYAIKAKDKANGFPCPVQGSRYPMSGMRAGHKTIFRIFSFLSAAETPGSPNYDKSSFRFRRSGSNG